jgi:hypothetical protein
VKMSNKGRGGGGWGIGAGGVELAEKHGIGAL